MSDDPEPTHGPELNDRQRKFVEAVARGLSVQEAARNAVYSPAYARKASRLLKCPAVARAIANIRERGRTLAAYGLVEAMNEANSAATFARLHKNPMALVKATELRAKLSGLLIDHVEVATVDLTKALAQAEGRVLGVMYGVPPRAHESVAAPATDPRVPGPTPGRPGNPFFEE